MRLHVGTFGSKQGHGPLLGQGLSLVHIDATTIIPLDIKESTRAFLKKSMKKVISKGTGKRLKQLKNITIYAKTSTAQTSALEKRAFGDKYLEHGWFTGYFSYKGQEPRVIVVLVEHAGSARVATNIAKEFFIEYKKHIDTLYPTPQINASTCA